MKMLEFAIAVEEAERGLYLRLAECSQNSRIRSIFGMIAEDEGKLLKKLRKLKSNPKNEAIELQGPAKTQTAFRRAQTGTCELLNQHHICDDLSSYSYILRTEQLLLNLYVNLRQREDDPEAKALFDLILQEKQTEIDRIHIIYDFVSAPDGFPTLGKLRHYDRDEL